jgi:hypothetical protein
MQPIKISIEGDYLDCQIYRDRLYLWTFDGTLKTIKWSELVDSLSNNINDKVALTFSFLDGNYLYKNNLKLLFEDPDFFQLLISKFDNITKNNYFLNQVDLDNFLYGQQSTPDNSLPTDTEIYNNNLYYINENGLYQTTAHRNNKKYPVSSKPNKLWDGQALSLKANKYPQLSVSAGNEGLFELDLYNLSRWDRREPKQLSKKHSSFANYAYQSVYNSSLIEESYIAIFDLIENNFDINHRWNFKNEQKYIRKFRDNISEEKIFDKTQHDLLSWGVEDKIYRATPKGFEIVRFNNYAKIDDGESYFSPVINYDINELKGRVIGGGTSYFGTILECENSLEILLSNQETFSIEGPITRWRVYPRSHFYENHLHVIKDNCLEIYSFNHDYFLDQKQKNIGIAYKNYRR